MGRFAKMWPDDVRESIIASVLDRGTTVKAAVQLAMSGRLTSAERPSEKVDVPKVKGANSKETERRLLANAYTWTAAAKRERSGATVPEWIEQDGPEKAIDQLAARMVAATAGEVRRIEKTRVGERDLDRLRKAAQVLREARALVRGESPTRSRRARDANAGQTPNGDGSAETGALGLLAASRADAHGANPRQDDTRQSDDRGRDDNARADTTGPEQQSDETGAAQSGGILGDASDERGQERARMAAELGIANPVTERDT